jgi:hypothetical protein
MVCDVQNYLGSGLCSSFGIKKLEHDVSETGSVSVFPRSPEDVNRSTFRNVVS